MAAMEPTTLREALLRAARTHGDRLAFAFDGRQLTFAELLDQASMRATALLRAGVGHRDRVAITIPAGLELVETFWAAALLGATPCVFNPAVRPEVLRRRVSLIRPAAVVTGAERGPAQTGIPPDPGVQPDDLAYLQLTSGTTGEPRAGMIAQRNLVAYCRAMDGLGIFRPGEDVFVGWVPPWHDLGLVRFVIEPVWRRTPCHLVTPAIASLGDWLRTISRVGGTHSGAPDFAYRLATRLVDPEDVDLTTLFHSTNGGEPPRRSTIEAFEARFRAHGAIRPGYGMGEVVLGLASQLPDAELVTDDHGNVCCGRAYAGFDIRAGTSPDEPSEILVRGPAVFVGYFDAEEETARALEGGWLHTGDVGYLDSDERLYVLGRRGGMIKRSGAQLAARELEEGALRVEGVRAAAAVTVAGTGEDHADTIVVAVEASVDDVAALQAAVVREVVAEVGFAPGRVEVLPPRTLPRTENGKTRYAALAEMLRDGAAAVQA